MKLFYQADLPSQAEFTLHVPTHKAKKLADWICTFEDVVMTLDEPLKILKTAQRTICAASDVVKQASGSLYDSCDDTP